MRISTYTFLHPTCEHVHLASLVDLPEEARQVEATGRDGQDERNPLVVVVVDLGVDAVVIVSDARRYELQ